MLRLASLHVYPLKSARAVDLSAATVQPWGLAGDRRWMLVDTDRRLVTQREQPRLATVAVCHATVADGRPGLRVRLDADELPCDPRELLVAQPTCGPAETVRVWRDEVTALPAHPDAHQWFSQVLGVPVRLVYLDDPTVRPVDPRFGRPRDRVSFADGFPLLLTTVASLDALNALVGASSAPLPMNRFRPNVVLDGDVEPWAEDDWRVLRVGGVHFRVVKPSSRCVVTTTDQRTGVRGSEPLRALGKHRRVGTGLLFGQNLVPDLPPVGPAVLRVGDGVTVVE